jgi:hypothetical protein
MAINIGAALGAAVNTGISTYERLGEEELRAMQRAQLRKDIAEKEALDQAWRQSQARVGQTDDYTEALKTGSNIGTEQARMLSNQGALPTDTADARDFEREVAQSANTAMRENAMRQGAIPVGQAAPEMKPTEFTKAQGMEDYVKAAGQISRKGTVEAIQLKQLVRQSENEDKFFKKQEKLNDDLATIRGAGESYGLKGVYDVASKNGMKNLKFVEGKNGVGSRIQVLGPEGDVLQTISDVNSAVDKLSEVVMGRFVQESVNLLGSPKEVVAYMQGERQIKIKEREAADKGAYYQAYGNYLSSGGKSAKDSLKGRAQEYADLLVESGEINPATKKPYTAAEAKKFALGLVLKAPDTKAPVVNADGSVVMGGQLFVPDPNKPGNFLPARGLPGGAENPVVAAFRGANPNAAGRAPQTRAQLPSKAIPDDTDGNYVAP